MNYKDALFFIGKCLTITNEERNQILVEEELKTNRIDWDIIVKISTAHYVFPALYCNLKRAGYLHYLPEDLVGYMEHITELNRERNQQIIEQAKEINELLLSHDITPIFLKGTGNLLSGLYKDIGERMVGDIDFLTDKNKAQKAYNILTSKGYSKKISELFDDHRHLPRIVNPNKIAAIEIHKEMLIASKATFFNFNTIAPNIYKKEKIHFLSLEDQIKLTIFSKYINDDYYKLKNVNLRSSYDVFLLGHQLKTPFTITGTPLSRQLKAGLKISTFILSKPTFIPDLNDKTTTRYYNSFLKHLSSKKTITKKYLWLNKRLAILTKSFSNKSYFRFVFSRLTDISWYKRHFKI